MVTLTSMQATLCATSILSPPQHLGHVVSRQADAGWIGEAWPGPSYLGPGSSSSAPEKDVTNRNTTFMTGNRLQLARMVKDAGGVPLHGDQRAEWDAHCRSDFLNSNHR